MVKYLYQSLVFSCLEFGGCKSVGWWLVSGFAKKYGHFLSSPASLATTLPSQKPKTLSKCLGYTSVFSARHFRYAIFFPSTRKATNLISHSSCWRIFYSLSASIICHFRFFLATSCPPYPASGPRLSESPPHHIQLLAFKSSSSHSPWPVINYPIPPKTVDFHLSASLAQVVSTKLQVVSMSVVGIFPLTLAQSRSWQANCGKVEELGFGSRDDMTFKLTEFHWKVSKAKWTRPS